MGSNLLVVDPDPASQKQLARAFTDAGWTARFLGDPRLTGAGVRTLMPRVVVVKAEPGSAALREVLRGLEKAKLDVPPPVIQLCEDLREARFSGVFKSGVVELLALPFEASSHVARVDAVLRGLETRSGTVQGTGASGELQGLVRHLRFYRRSGTLEARLKDGETATATFVRGTVLSAQLEERTGEAALAALVASGSTRWKFTAGAPTAERPREKQPAAGAQATTRVQTSAVSQAAPSQASRAPAPSSRTATASSKAPAPSSQTATASSKAPAPSSQTATTSSKAPAPSSQAATTSSKAPAPSSQAGTASSKDPAPTAEPGVSVERVVETVDFDDMADFVGGDRDATSGSDPARRAQAEPVIELALASDDDEGIELVLDLSDEVPPPAATLSHEAPAVPQNDSQPRVLLVDDDAELLRMFGLVLSKRGFDVDTATDGEAGFRRAVSAPYDVVVADLNMPHLDGWGMLRKLREDFRSRELPVAFLSAHDDYRETLNALDAGAQAYLSKSVRHEELISAIRSLLAPRQALEVRAAGGNVDGDVDVGLVGPMWLLTLLGRTGFSGWLDARDDWAGYQVFFREGVAVHAIANLGNRMADGLQALHALVSSSGAHGTLTTATLDTPKSLDGPLDALLERARAMLNEHARRARETDLAKARSLNVNTDLYALYAQVGPRASLEIARLLCEERVSPPDLIGKMEISPLDVDATLHDLVRRGVVSVTSS